MANPFAAFNTSDDEDDRKPTIVKADPLPRRTRQDKKLFKQQQDQNDKKATEISGGAVSQPLPEKFKENSHSQYMERPKREWKKELDEGHYHDKQSGTGRDDKPRKAGGYGGAGDTKYASKYDKEYEEKKGYKPLAEGEVAAEVVEQKPAEPEAPTLEEYYKAKGVDLAYNPQAKAATKKGEIKADWIKKEKLTLITTKEDLKKEDRNNEQTVKQTSAKVGLGIDESDFGKVGFGKKPKEAREQRTEEPKKGGAKKKPQFSAEDFPSL